MELLHGITASPSPFHTLKGKRVCITGGCGFVGTRIADAFIFAGVAQITLFDVGPLRPAPMAVIEREINPPQSSEAFRGYSEALLRPTDEIARQMVTAGVSWDRTKSRWNLGTSKPSSSTESGQFYCVDWVPSNSEVKKHGWTPVQIRIAVGDVSNSTDVNGAIVDGCDVVVHLAAFGMSGSTMLQTRKIERINIKGTQCVIDRCKAAKVKALVYASSYNAVFCGQELINSGADVERPPASAFYDDYSRTKSQAEGMVLAVNSDALKTVALRLSGIYGPGEQRHFPRTISMIKAGLVKFTIGGTTNLVDWVYVDNVAFSFALASAQALNSKVRRVCGRAFPVSDHHPVNQWLMMEPLFKALGCSMPWINIPMTPMFYLAAFMDVLLRLLAPIVELDPFLTRGEILKVGIEHYFDPKASDDIGYAPVVPYEVGVARTVAFFVRWADKKYGHQKRNWKLLAAAVCVLAVLVSYVFVL